jgi:hypothetical protein
MTAIYEFHVSGQVGSVIRSALPEMQTFEESGGRTLRGIAAERRDIDRLLESIQLLNVVVQQLHIATRPECSLVVDDDVPVVDDGGAQRDVL